MESESLKCLSAFGFWGTEKKFEYFDLWNIVSNAFRLLGSGEPSVLLAVLSNSDSSLKCLSAFGFWGTLKKRCF